jgi:uncharacterized delta-60 repeat protein
LEDRCLLSAGALDPTFGSGGIVNTGPSGTAYAVALQTDGKIVVAGTPATGGSAGTVARYTPTGALDTSFGNGGSAAVSFFKSQGTNLLAVALDSSGKIVVAGNAGLARLTSSGSLDTSFGNKGEVLTPMGAELDAVVIEPNGQILAAGWANTNGSGASFGVLARYNANGTLDTSFGSGGLVTTYLAAQATFSALALQSDGKILAGGREGLSATNNNFLFAVARFNPNGSLDKTFGSGGVVTTSIAGNASAIWDTGVHSVLIQSNGMIVAAGTVKNGTGGAEVALTRYDASGNLDPTFGAGGIALTSTAGTTYDAAVAAALQSDGKIVTAGYHNSSYFELERYTTAGTLDSTFNGTGIVTTAIGSGAASAYGIAIYQGTDTTGNAGKIVAVGNANGNFAVARYLGDSVAGPSFSVTGFPSSITAGTAGTFTVTALNGDGSTNTNYIGTVHFNSSDPHAVLPADDTFTAADLGVHTFSATLVTAGNQSITATDTATSSTFGSETSITVNPAAASAFIVGVNTSMTQGVSDSFVVTAVDPYGNQATGYTGTVTFSSSDPLASLPGNYTFTVADAGRHYFIVTLNTVGTESLTATDTLNASITGTGSGISVVQAVQKKHGH